MKTAEQIAKAAEPFDGVGNIRVINREYRKQEKAGHIERAIRNVRKIARANGAIYGLEYCYAIEYELTNIVNSQF